MTEIAKNLPKIRGQYRFNAPVKNWFDVGGNAEILFKPSDIKDLQDFLKNRDKFLQVTIIGAASNVIVADDGVKGVVIRLGGEFSKIKHDGEVISAGCASLCGSVASYSQIHGLAGLEFFSGIPGSIGGAVAMNAGCYDGDVAKSLISAKALDYEGNLHELSRQDFEFSYRKNNIADNFIFVEASFKAEKSSPEAVLQKIREFAQNRENSQPIRAKTGGSTFKNPFPQDANAKKAWQLIDEAACRGIKIGDAQISPKHCNFMINTGSATANDLIELGNFVKNKVKKVSNIDLNWEIKIIGSKDDKK